MSANFKIRFEKPLIACIVSFIVSVQLLAQPVSLLPELYMNHGLRHDVVRVVRQDAHGKVWVGTDAGLKVLSSQDPGVQSLMENLQGESVLSIAFLKGFAFAGTVASGLHILDESQGRIVKHPAFDTLGYVRRIRVLGDTVFVAANHAAGYVTIDAKGPSWHALKWKHLPNGYIFDFYRYQGKVFGIDHNNNIMPYYYEVRGDSLIKTDFPASIPPPHYFIHLTAEGDESELRIGGDGFYATLNQKGEHAFTRIKDSLEGMQMAVWDMAKVGNRQFLALGQPMRMRMGAAYEWGKSHLSDIRQDFYCKSLQYDVHNDALWMGTYNRGLFLWPQISLTQHLPVQLGGHIRIMPFGPREQLLYNDRKVYRIFDDGRQPILISTAREGQKFEDIYEVKSWKDTIAVLRESGFHLYDKVGTLINAQAFQPHQYTHFNFLRNDIAFFSTYNTGIVIMDRRGGRMKSVEGESIEVRSIPYRDGLFYMCEETGFKFLDNKVHAFTPAITKAFDFTLVSDTLWMLNDGKISRYLISLATYKLQLIDEFQVDKIINGMTVNWIRHVREAGVIVGNSKALVKLDAQSMKPVWYRYLGNHEKMEMPEVDGDSLLLIQQPWMAKIPVSQPFSENRLSTINVHFPNGTRIGEGQAVEVKFMHADYFLQQHSLKRLEIMFPDGHAMEYFGLDSLIIIPQGLPQGKYKLTCYVNGKVLGNWTLRVTIPLLRNPWFYGVMTLLFTGLIFFGFRYRSRQKDLERNMLESRLQLMKKNLDPHFIFNSLNLTYMLLIEEKYDEATQSIFKFSELHRYFLEMIGKHRVYLKEEWTFIRNYLDVEEMRAHMDAPFEVEISPLSREMELIEIPPLVLHPLVENAVKYCRPLQEGHSAAIWIDFQIKEGTLIISVENTSDGLENSATISFGKGLSIVEETLSVNNRLGHKTIELHKNMKLKRYQCGYRSELWFHDVIR